MSSIAQPPTNAFQPPQASEPLDDYSQYRAMSTAAVASLVFGLLSGIIFFTTSYLGAAAVVSLIPLMGILLSVAAIRGIRCRSSELAGMPLALGGLTLSVSCLLGGLGFAAYLRVTEVPEGYERISFGEMKPDDLETAAGRAIPPEILALEGEKVFIRGYMRPPEMRTNVTDFLLVRDNNQCCFGPLNAVKYYDQIHVRLAPPRQTDYSTRLYRLGGVLQIHPENLGRGTGYPIFSLKADHLQ